MEGINIFLKQYEEEFDIAKLSLMKFIAKKEANPLLRLSKLNKIDLDEEMKSWNETAKMEFHNSLFFNESIHSTIFLSPIAENGKKKLMNANKMIKDERKKYIEPDSELAKIVKNFFKNLSSFAKMKYYFLQYNLKEVTKQKLSYSLGFLSCLLVVISILITLSALAQMPVVLLRVAEIERGQFDVSLYSNSKYGSSLNFSKISKITKKMEFHGKYSLSSPRIVFHNVFAFKHSSCMVNATSKNVSSHLLNLVNPTNGKFLYDLKYIQWMHKGINDTECYPDDCVSNMCSESFEVSLVVADSEKDKTMGLGRKFNAPKLAKDEIYISSYLSKSLDVGVGDIVIFQINNPYRFLGMFKDVGIVSNATDYYSNINWNVFVPYKVVGITDFEGRVDWDSLGYEIGIVEYSSFLSHASNYIAPKYNHFKHSLASINAYDYSQNVLFNMPNRIQQYANQDYEVVRNRVSKFAAELAFICGFDQVKMDYPVVKYLKTLDLIGLFLNLIVNVIIVVLVGISIILIYSLLLVNVEGRTFEMGVLRMVGLDLFGLLQLILVQSFMYSVPAILFGVFLGQFSYIIVSLLLQYYLDANIPWILSPDAVLLSLLIGFSIPLLGSILPIKAALSKNLNDSLSTNRPKVKAVKVTIQTNDNDSGGIFSIFSSINWNLLIISVFFFTFGFAFYYLMPLALISMKLSLLLLMFFCVILMMLLGLIILFLNFESIIEKMFVLVLFFWESVSVRSLVLKNLVAHRERNRKSTLMYGVSLAFVIFISISFSLEIETYKFNRRKLYGTRLHLKSPSTAHKTLGSSEFLSNLQSLKERENGKIIGYALKSWPLSKAGKYARVYMHNIGRYNLDTIDPSAVSPNFFEILDESFLKPTIQRSNPFTYFATPASLSRQLYSSNGSFSMILGLNIQEKLGIKDLDHNIVCAMHESKTNKIVYSLVRPNSLLEGAAASSFSKFKTSFLRKDLKSEIVGEDAYVSFSTFTRLLGRNKSENRYFSVNEVPIKYVYFKFASWVSDNEINRIKSEIKKCYYGMDKVFMKDIQDKLKTMDVVDNVMNLFFYLSSIVTLVLCFFSLISNMFMNVKEQSKEIAILRAIGCRKWFMRRVYVYEALVVIYTASFIGVIVGTAVSYTMILQQTLFTQLPISIDYPWVIVVIVIMGGIVSAICASIFPINAMLKKEVVGIFRSK